MDSNTEVVVARYKEDVAWLAPIAHFVILYNKGPPLEGDDAKLGFKRVVQLPNVGREAHTYLTHIVENWEGLAPVTVFIQARITDHIPPIFRENPVAYVETIGQDALQHGLSLNAAVHRKGLMSAIPEFKMSRMYPYIRDTGLNYEGWLRAHVFKHVPGHSGRFPHNIQWSIGALFAARKDAIHRSKKELYEGLLALVDNHVDPEDAYFLERTWHYLMRDAHIKVLHPIL